MVVVGATSMMKVRPQVGLTKLKVASWDGTSPTSEAGLARLGSGALALPALSRFRALRASFLDWRWMRSGDAVRSVLAVAMSLSVAWSRTLRSSARERSCRSWACSRASSSSVAGPSSRGSAFRRLARGGSRAFALSLLSLPLPLAGGALVFLGKLRSAGESSASPDLLRLGGRAGIGLPRLLPRAGRDPWSRPRSVPLSVSVLSGVQARARFLEAVVSRKSRWQGPRMVASVSLLFLESGGVLMSAKSTHVARDSLLSRSRASRIKALLRPGVFGLSSDRGGVGVC